MVVAWLLQLRVVKRWLLVHQLAGGLVLVAEGAAGAASALMRRLVLVHLIVDLVTMVASMVVLAAAMML